jgi:exodeoxyribonuclease V alpha subunit
MQHYVMLRRNLLYTAVTRGKRLVVLVGSERAIRRAVDDTATVARQTGLCARLRALRATVGA